MNRVSKGSDVSVIIIVEVFSDNPARSTALALASIGIWKAFEAKAQSKYRQVHLSDGTNPLE